jgi:hypothetical protein
MRAFGPPRGDMAGRESEWSEAFLYIPELCCGVLYACVIIVLQDRPTNSRLLSSSEIETLDMTCMEHCELSSTTLSFVPLLLVSIFVYTRVFVFCLPFVFLGLIRSLFLASSLYLLSYFLFNDAFSVTKTIQHRMKGWQMNDELERICEEGVVV